MRHAPIALVLVLTALAFAPCLTNGFVNWDDYANIVDNWMYRGLGAEQLRWMFTTTHMGHYQPLAWVTLGADYTIWSMNPFGYHLTSVLFHIANAALFYLVAVAILEHATAGVAAGSGNGAAGRLAETQEGRIATHEARALSSKREPVNLAAAFAAGLFALHPLRVESVAWVTERRDVVSGFFFLLSLLAYLRGASEASRSRRTLSLAAFAAALASKATSVVLPAILLLLDEYPLRRRAREHRSAAQLVAEKMPYFVLATLAIAVGLRAQHSAVAFPTLDHFSMEARIATALYGLAFYVRKTLVPLDLTPAHMLDGEPSLTSPVVLASAALVAGITVAAVAFRRRSRAPLIAWIAYIVSVAPVLGVVQDFSYAAADRYSYLAGLSFALLGGGALRSLLAGRKDSRRKVATLAAGACVLLALSVLTSRQCRIWRDSESLWRHTIAADPKNAIAYDNLGHELIRQRRLDNARAAFEAALTVRPGFSDALAGLGQIALLEMRPEDARAPLERALAAWPENPVALTNLGVARLQTGDAAGAVEAFRAAASADPAFFDAWHNLGATLLVTGDSVGAVEALTRAAAIRPGDAATQRKLDAALGASRR
jgi:tetratricopeptide (TPR) repeat protein